LVLDGEHGQRQPVRITILVIRLLAVLWLAFLGAALSSAGNPWGWTLLPAAVAVLALSLWGVHHRRERVVGG
jgi:hypothetical protein